MLVGTESSPLFIDFVSVMADLESSIVKSERRRMTAVIKPWHEKRKEKEKHIQWINSGRLNIAVVGFLLVSLSLTN